MKKAADFRAAARAALKGQWRTAVLTVFVASLLGVGSVSFANSSQYSSNLSGTSLAEFSDQLSSFLSENIGIVFSAVAISVIWAIAVIIISGAVKFGYACYFLKLADGEKPRFSTLFSQMDRIWPGFCMNFFVNLFIGLWSMLLFIPGLIKTYSYSMTAYIMAERPGMGARAAITESRYLMDGNKWRLFCLGFSFIGWSILCAAPVAVAFPLCSFSYAFSESLRSFLPMLPMGIVSFIGALFLTAYHQTAVADFYRSISGTGKKTEAEVISE
ncbi:MAG: DUF975 family protein [Oscillospiraceae bacterium]|nr:DUF975 family protein [Oscillospiraceae bacterium]